MGKNTYQLDEVLTPEARESLRHLELYARRVADGVLHGEHRSRRKGISTDFDHHKIYQPGDPLRQIDWKVSARHDEYFVKRYIEDTALSVRIVVDRSASMLQESGGPTRYLQAARLAASLAYLILKQRDLVGLVLTASDETFWLPMRSGDLHLVHVLRALASKLPAAEDSLRTSLEAILERAERRGLIAVISDLMFDPAPVQRQLAKLQAQGHEVLVFQLRDPTEEAFPFNRWVRFIDRENPAVRHRIDPVPLKKIYLEEYQRLIDRWKDWAGRQDVHFLSVRTDETLQTVLGQYLFYRTEVSAKS